MEGNSVNHYETDELIKKLMPLIDELLENLDSEDLQRKVLLVGEEFREHALNLRIHTTANVWARDRHLENSKKFSAAFDYFKQVIKKSSSQRSDW